MNIHHHLLVTALLTSVPLAMAQEATAQNPDAPKAAAPAWTQGWLLGGAVSHGNFREPGLMQVQGPRLGVWAEKPMGHLGRWQPTLRGLLQSSAMHYSSPISGELPNVPDHELEVRVTALHPLGQSDEPRSPWAWGVYAGLGYRLHYNDLRGTTSNGAVGYQRLNQRLTLPLGLQVKSASGITARLELSPALYGTHTTYMSDVGALADATVPQKSQSWAIEVGWQPWPQWELRLYHRQASTQATDAWSSTINGVTRRYLEPASTWHDTGIRIARQF